MRTIEVIPYNPGWPDDFNRIKDELASALANTVISIEHVGSTSVPGLWAKPIIDIDIVIDIDRFDIVKIRLDKIGYTHLGDLGIKSREAFKYTEKPHLAAHHLYVCDKNAEELKRHLCLRDFLRKNDDYRDKYSKIKIEMAKKFPHDIDRYIKGKEPVVLEIYAASNLKAETSLKQV